MDGVHVAVGVCVAVFEGNGVEVGGAGVVGVKVRDGSGVEVGMGVGGAGNRGLKNA